MVTANLAPRSIRYNGAAAVAYDDDDDADDGDGAAPCLPCTYSQSRTQLLDLYLIFFQARPIPPNCAIIFILDI